MWESDTKPALLYIKDRLRDPNSTRDVKKDLVACALFFIWWSAVAPDTTVSREVAWVTTNLKNAMYEYHVFDKCRAMVWPALMLIGEPRIGKSAGILLRCITTVLLGERMAVIAGEHSNLVTIMAESMEVYKQCFKDIFHLLVVPFDIYTDDELTDVSITRLSDPIGQGGQPWIAIFKYHHTSTKKFYNLYEKGVITHVCLDEAHTPIKDNEGNAACESVKRAEYIDKVLGHMRSMHANGSIMFSSGTPNIMLQAGTLHWYINGMKIVLFKMAANYGPEYINLESKEDVQYVSYLTKPSAGGDMLLNKELEPHYEHMFDTACAYGVSWLSTRQQVSTVTKAVKPLYDLASKLGKQLHVFTLGHAGITHFTPSGSATKLKERVTDKKQSEYVMPLVIPISLQGGTLPDTLYIVVLQCGSAAWDN